MSQLHFRTEGNTVKFFGSLSENTEDSIFSECAKKLNSLESINLDFSGIDGANSNGIIKLSKFFGLLNVSYKFINTPIWLLESFSMVSNLLKDKSLVSTVVLPFYSEDEDKEILRTFEIGKEIPILDDYSDFELDDVKQDGIVYGAEFDETMIFSFLSK